MSGTYSQRGGRKDFEDWDSIFEDAEPTRVISPEAVQHARRPGASLESQIDHQGTVSATRYEQASYSRRTQESHPTTSQLPAIQQEKNSSQGIKSDLPVVSTYRRIQFIPSSSGTLVAYALITGLFALVRSVFGVLGISTYSSPTGAVLAVSTASSQGQALPWVVASTVIWVFSFGCAGYTASRMAVVAPTKQALGVLAVSFLAVLVATLVTWLVASPSHQAASSFALQPLLAPDLAIGFLTALAIGLLAIIGSMLGAWSGIRYHQALTRNNSPNGIYSSTIRVT